MRPASHLASHKLQSHSFHNILLSIPTSPLRPEIKEYQEGGALSSAWQKLQRLPRLCHTQAGFGSESRHFSDRAREGESGRGRKRCQVGNGNSAFGNGEMGCSRCLRDDRQLIKNESKARPRN